MGQTSGCRRPRFFLFLDASIGVAGETTLDGRFQPHDHSKTFLWSTTLGMVSEQSPRGGALTLNGVSAIGVLGMGVIGSPLMGVWQDLDIDRTLRANHGALHAEVRGPDKLSLLGTAPSLDAAKVDALPQAQKQTVVGVQNEFKKLTFARTALLPALLLVCYLGLFFYFRSRRGYRPQELDAGH